MELRWTNSLWFSFSVKPYTILETLNVWFRKMSIPFLCRCYYLKEGRYHITSCHMLPLGLRSSKWDYWNPPYSTLMLSCSTHVVLLNKDLELRREYCDIIVLVIWNRPSALRLFDFEINSRVYSLSCTPLGPLINTYYCC